MKKRRNVKGENRGSSISRLAVAGAVMCLLSLALSGCQDSAQTEEEIVIPKQEEQGAETSAEDTGTGESDGEGQMEEGAVEGAIAEQVQAPESYSWEGSDEVVSVKVDAPVIIPQGEGFKSWKVTSRVFTQEDYDKVSAVLLKGAELWERDEELMGGSHGFTADEVRERIKTLEQREKAYKDKGMEGKVIDDGKEINFTEEIEKWRQLEEKAPEEVITVPVPGVVDYTENTENSEDNLLWGTATVDGRDFWVNVDNNLTDSWRWINFEIRDAETNSNFINVADEGSAAAAALPKEEIRGMAQEAMAAMGFTDFTVAGEEYFSSFSADESSLTGETNIDQVGYGIYFTRELDGIPLTYTHAMGTSIEDGVETSWPYETVWMVYTKDGFANFNWIDPYQVEKESDEYVFLLPWSEIQGIFEEMMVKKYSDFFADAEGAKVEFVLDEVRLGYARVTEKGNFMEGKMVPVWDFFGSETIMYPDMEEPYTLVGPYESWLTINAMDGTIIDRELGY